MAEVTSPPRTPEIARRRRTIGALWRTATAGARSTPAYLVEEDDGWHPVSLDEAARRVDELANGLLALGAKRGDAIGIVGATRIEWVLLDFAIGLVGAVAAPVYPTSAPAESAYLLRRTKATLCFVEDDGKKAELESLRSELPDLGRLFTFAQLREVELLGREHAHRDPGALERAEAAIDEEDLFTYIFTSGTTGPPKACMIRHRNYFEMVATVDRVEEFLLADDVMLLWLPLAHNFGRLLHLLGPHAGYTIAFVPDPYRVGDVLTQVRPTILPSAPRLFEKMYATVKARLDDASGPRRKLVDWALGVGSRSSPYVQRGERLPAGLALQRRVADRLVYSKVKGRVGGRLRFAVSGAAPLSADISSFFHALDILILEGYGLTECTTACSVNRPGRVRFGTVGPALPGFEIRIAEDGEVLVRSETVFAGYLDDDDATRAALTDDGWLRTGDVGELDDDGFLRITDRKKDLIVTAGGKNVAPQNLESALKRCRLVSQALVVGDCRPHLVALVTLDADAAAVWARERRVEAGLPALAEHPELRAAIERAIDDVNRDLARFEQIKRFKILPRDFSQAEDEVTPTMKLRRKQIEERFANEIEALYAAESPTA